jgi:hypothetical protein
MRNISGNFDLFLPAIPGSSDTRDLTFKCQTLELPGTAFEDLDVALHGVTVPFPGRKIYTHSIQMGFLETNDWGTRAKFGAWMEAIRSWRNNSGTLSSAYKVSGQIVVYDDIPEVVRTVNLSGLYPQTMGEVAMDGGSTNIVSLAITFKYTDWVDSV